MNVKTLNSQVKSPLVKRHNNDMVTNLAQRHDKA